MYAEQSAFFVATIDVMQLIDLLSYDYRIFISYDVSVPNISLASNFQLSLYAGNLSIDAKTLSTCDMEINKNSKESKIKSRFNA